MENKEGNNTFLYRLIHSMSSIMAASDSYTVNHQNNVAAIARLIGQKMELSAFEIEGVRVAGQLHDIGKSTIPNELLSKYGKLIFEEFALIRSHARAADQLLSGIDFPWPIREMVLQHHERMDGSGYPHGISGNEICLGARILIVADVTDAMMNARPYRKALGLDAVIGELTENAHLYDTDVCNAFMAVVSDGGRRLVEAITITH